MILTALKTRSKLAASFLLILFLMMLSGAVSLHQASRINASTVDLAENWLPSINFLGDLKEQANLVRRAEFRYILEEDAEPKRAMEKAIEGAKGKFELILQRYKPLATSDEERARFKRSEQSWLAYTAATPKILALANHDGDKSIAKKLLFGESFKSFNELSKNIEDCVEINRQGASNSKKDADSYYARAKTAMLSMVGVSLTISVILGVLLTRSVTRPLGAEPQEINALMVRLAEGDLRTISAAPEASTRSVLTAVVSLQKQLAASLTEVRVASDSVAVATEQIAQGNANLAARTEEQASGLEETAAAIEQLTAAVQGSAESARQADQLARQVSEVATEGGLAVQNMVNTMTRIQDSSRRIADIIGVIDGIAFQTNILALNAAVEAARAGEQGRGFAVVATEVRALAGRSAAAAKEIKSLISRSVEEVDAGSALAGQVGHTIDSVVAQVRHVTTLVSAISASSAEQTTGISQINDAIGRLDTNTQENSSLVEETASAAASLNQQAQALTRAVAVFRLDGAASDGYRLHAVANGNRTAQPKNLSKEPQLLRA